MGAEILFPLLAVLLLVVMFNSQRKRQRQAAQLQSQLAPGTRICTTSGLFGTVLELTDQDVLIEAAPGVHLRYDRRAIGLVVPSEVTSDGVGEQDVPGDPDTSGESGGHNRPA